MGEAPLYPSAPPSLAAEAPPDSWPVAPAVPEAVQRRQSWSRHRWAALFAGCAAWMAGAGALMPWARYADGSKLTGIDQGNGWIALVLAFATAILAGATFFGAHHRSVRVLLVLAALGTLGLFFFNRYRVHQADGRSKVGPVLMATGLQFVGIAGFILLAAALLTAPWEGLRRRAA